MGSDSDRPRGRRALGGCLLLGMSLVLAAAAGAAPEQVPGATYKGDTSRGGIVRLEVSADGRTVTHFGVTVGLPCGRPLDTFGYGGNPIVGKAFSYSDPDDPTFSYSGSFSGQSAQGRLSYRPRLDPACNADLTWSAGVLRTLTVRIVGRGFVKSEPADFNCGPTRCTGEFAGTVTLIAEAGSMRYFAGWSGGGCSGTGRCVVRMDADRSITATFKTWKVTITKRPPRRSTARTATFAWTSNAPGSTYKCMFSHAVPGTTSGPPAPCRSPRTYRGLKPGPYAYDFWLQATNAKGAYGPITTYRFSVTG